MALPYPTFLKSLLKAIVPMRVKRHLYELASANSVEIALYRLKGLGFEPSSIIDIGAHDGKWTGMARRVFPNAWFLMIEALEEKRHRLEAIKARFPQSTAVEICLLGAKMNMCVPFFAMETGSSIYEELSEVPRHMRPLTTRTLDSVLTGHDLPAGPVLAKLDVQGAELDVLTGGSLTLRRVPVVMLEVPITSYNRGAPTLDDVLSFMTRRGYRLFDIAALLRPDGEKLVQMDAVFVNKQFPM
jgi:FkbM family methyltransferase